MDIFAIIEACERVGKMGFRLYKISKEIGDNFSENTNKLRQKVEALSQRVVAAKTALDETRIRDVNELSGLNKVVLKIEKEFKKIDDFFKKLQKYGGIEGAKYLYNNVKKYRKIQQQFQDSFRILDELDKRLQNSVQDSSLMVAVRTQFLVENLREEHEIQYNDLRTLFNRFQEMPKAIIKEMLEKENFLKGRFEAGSPLPKAIEPSEISEREFLCQGTYCEYYTATLDREKVIVKCVHPEDLDNKFIKESFAKDTRNLIKISSGSITRVLGMCDKPTEKFLVMEYMERGNLSDVLHEGGELSFSQRVDLASSAAKSLYRFHTMMVHRSLRTEKFLVDKHYTCKLSGLASGMTFSSCERYNRTSPPIVDVNLYRAPERFMPAEPIKKEADIYAFGIVLWEIFTQEKPFAALEAELGRKPTTPDLKNFLVDSHREEYEFGDQSNSTILELNDLIRKCRSAVPDDRPTASDIESILSGIDDELDQ